MGLVTAGDAILVTGGSGQLGSELMHESAVRGLDAVGLGHAELDVTDATRVCELVAALRPAAIVHCAAWTVVDDAEVDPAGALRVNGEGTANVVAAARDVGAYLLTVSTDYVFAGDDAGGYDEGSATDPINAYGASKLAAEHVTLELPGAAVARTAWLFGATGTNFVRTIIGLALQRDAIDVVTDQVGSPTYAPHLAGALLDCVQQRLPGVLHLVGSPTATWFDVASEVVRVLGASCEVRPTTSDRFPRPARRPACSILRATRADTPSVGDWRDGVHEVVAALRVSE